MSARYLVWRAGETSEAARAIDTWCAEAAAGQWAEKDDRESAAWGDTKIVDGGTARVHVQLADDPAAPVRTYDVRGVHVPSYYAELVREADALGIVPPARPP